MFRPRLALAAGFAACIFVPASAHAATKTVIAGPLHIVKGVLGGSAQADADSFSLTTVTIHVGDKVRWKFTSNNTVTFRKNGHGDIPLVIQNSFATYDGINDAAGSPFWFNNTPEYVLNPQAVLLQGKTTENGGDVTGSGAVFDGSLPKPYTLKFTRVGTYVYASTLHPDMKAKVVVVSRHRHIPSARDDHAQANSIFRAELKAAKGGRKFTPPKDTIQAGNDTLSVVQYAFFPQTLHVAVGTKVTVQVKSLPESHTFTFGPADYLQNLANNFEVPIQPATGPAKIELNGQLSLPSDPGPNLPAYDGTNHGNGFYNTGILDGNKISPRPSSETITFSKAGTYTYTDLLHPSMHGTVIVG